MTGSLSMAMDETAKNLISQMEKLEPVIAELYRMPGKINQEATEQAMMNKEKIDEIFRVAQEKYTNANERHTELSEEYHNLAMQLAALRKEGMNS